MRATISGDQKSFEVEDVKGLATTERMIRVSGDDLLISDGYHTMNELYEHRIALFIALCRHIRWVYEERHDLPRHPVWRSKLHSDGSNFDGRFIMGIGKEKNQQITYHLPMAKWDDTEFAETLEKAPEWDGHTATDVLGRLQLL